MTWHTRLTQARTARKIKKIDFARRVGVSPPTVTQWENGETKKIEGENLVKVCRILNISADWLLYGTGPGPSGDGVIDVQAKFINEPLALHHKKMDESGEIEIQQYLGVGGSMGNGVLLRDQPGEIHSWRVTPEWVQKNVPSNTGVENLAIVTGFGPSMRGMFNPGDPLLVDRGVREVKHDAVYFFRVGDEGFIKILQRVPGVGLRAISKNKEFETWTITPDMDFEVFAKVLKVWQSEDF